MNQISGDTWKYSWVILEKIRSMLKYSLVAMSFLSMVSLMGQNLGLKWSKRIDSVNDLYLTDIEADAQNNIYVIGQFSAPTDMDPGVGVSNIFSNGDQDVFVAKYSSNGGLIWVKTFGGFGLEMANSLAVNDQGQVVIFFQAEDYIDLDPLTPNNELTFPGDGAVLLWLSTDGQLLSGRSWSGSINTQDNSNQIAIDDVGNTYVLGTPNNKFIKYNTQYQLEWEKTVNISSAQSVVTDIFGNVYVAALISGTGYFLPQEFVGFYSVAGTNFDVFVSKFNGDGEVMWSGNVGSINSEFNARLETDGISKLFLTYDANGSVQSGLLESGALSPYYGSSDVVLSCYDLNGTEQWTNVLGTFNPEVVTALTYSAQTNEVFIGTFIYPGFDGDPTGGTTPNAGPVYGYSVVDGSISSWGERFMTLAANGASQTFHYSPYLKALNNGRLIAGDRCYLAIDLLPGGAEMNYNYPVYGLYLAAYGLCEPTSSTLNVTVCEGESFSYNGNSLVEGNYEYHFANAGGCDSLVQLNVSVWPTQNISRTVAACSSPYNYGGQAINTTGTYDFEWTNDNGCPDSVVSLYVYFVSLGNPIVSGVANNYFLSATANLTGIYTFINCDNNQVIQQGNSSSCNIQNDGNYRIEFDQTVYPGSTCTIVSSCVFVGSTLVEQVKLEDFKIYPNPISDRDRLTIPNDFLSYENFIVCDIAGKKVFSTNQRKGEWSVEEMGLSSGQYILIMQCTGSMYQSRFSVMK